MKILFIYQFCSLGGVETCLRNRLKNVDENSEIDILFFDNYGGTELFDDINCNIHFIKDTNKIIHFIESGQYEVVAAIDTPQIIPILNKARYGGEVILECHTTYEESLRYLNELDMNNISCLVVPSGFQRQLVLSRLNQSIEVVVVPNTVDQDIFYPSEEQKMNTPIIGWVGRLDEHKNWKMFVELIRYLVKNGLDIKGCIVGGKGSDPQVIEELRQRIIKYKLGSHFIWLPYVENKDMGKIYSKIAASNGFAVNTSKCESFGMTIIEAMACKCLVISNNFEVASELIEQSETGLIESMKPKNLQNILETIIEVQNNREHKEKMIEKAYKEVCDKYSVKEGWKRYIEVVTPYMKG